VPLSRRSATSRCRFCSHLFGIEILGRGGEGGVVRMRCCLRTRSLTSNFFSAHKTEKFFFGLARTHFARLREPHAKWTSPNNLSLESNKMATETFVLPGETLDPTALPSHPKLPLKLGPGLRHIPPNTITPTVAGQLCTDKRKNAVWVEFNGSRVRPVSLRATLANRTSTSLRLAT
jgi:Exosome complex exonuclease Rrp40 N-terminal domain